MRAVQRAYQGSMRNYADDHAVGRLPIRDPCVNHDVKTVTTEAGAALQATVR
jgi:hypothetical protein